MLNDIFFFIVAISPLFLLVVLMTIFKVSASRAGFIALFIVCLIAILLFQAPFELLYVEFLKAVWNTAPILYIIFSALFLYEIVSNSESMNIIGKELDEKSPNELIKILCIGWIFAGFLQGITGFGVPVAICVPILISIGVKPLYSILFSLLGQMWGNTFGTLSVAWNVIEGLIDINENELTLSAILAALLLWIINVAGGILICYFYGGVLAVKKGLLFVVIISTTQGAGELLLVTLNPQIAAFLPAFAALLIGFFLSKTKKYKDTWKIENSKIMYERIIEDSKDIYSNKERIIAILPYILLTCITLILFLITPLNDLLSKISISLEFPETSTGLGIVNNAVDEYGEFFPFVDAGTILLITALLSHIVIKKTNMKTKKKFTVLIVVTARKMLPTLASVLILMIMSKVMSASGQTIAIANGISLLFCDYFVFVSPIIGFVGSFVTGSNMSSNILFVDVQQGVANSLGLNKSIIVAEQTVGGAIGSIAAPSKIVLGTTSAGIAGQEGKVLRLVLPIALALSVIIGFLSGLISILL